MTQFQPSTRNESLYIRKMNNGKQFSMAVSLQEMVTEK